MPVIAFSSPKGGAGKTTAATIFATRICAVQQNTAVTTLPHACFPTSRKYRPFSQLLSQIADSILI